MVPTSVPLANPDFFQFILSVFFFTGLPQGLLVQSTKIWRRTSLS